MMTKRKKGRRGVMGDRDGVLNERKILEVNTKRGMTRGKQVKEGMWKPLHLINKGGRRP